MCELAVKTSYVYSLYLGKVEVWKLHVYYLKTKVKSHFVMSSLLWWNYYDNSIVKISLEAQIHVDHKKKQNVQKHPCYCFS